MVSHMSLLGTDVLHEIIFESVEGQELFNVERTSITAQNNTLMAVKRKLSTKVKLNKVGETFFPLKWS